MRAVKTWLRKIAPTPYQAALEFVWKQRLHRHASIKPHVDAFIEKNGLTIHAGPFAGMPYVEAARGSAYAPKLIGSYEVEIRPFIERIVQRKHEVIVDIGCAEGYYAVGLATRKPGTVVYAFDTDESATALCRKLAERNGVADRVLTKGRCEVEDLAKIPLSRGLVFCDCEGFEAELLDPAVLPQLRHADILVELHEGFVPNITRLIQDRFAQSHDIETVRCRPRDDADWPQIASYSSRARRLMLHELRFAPVNWAFMTPRRSLVPAT